VDRAKSLPSLFEASLEVQEEEPLLENRMWPEKEAPMIIEQNRSFSFMKIPILGTTYCFVSICAVFLNKALLTEWGLEGVHFDSVEFLMFVQAILGTVLLMICWSLGILDFPILIPGRLWPKVIGMNMAFVLMTGGNAYAVKHLSFSMVALLKNSQVVLVAFIEYLILGTEPGKLALVCLFMIVGGSVAGSVTDISFDFYGYVGMSVAVLSSSLYFVSLKLMFKEDRVPEFTLVFWNNVLSIFYFAGVAMLGNGFMYSAQTFWQADIAFTLTLMVSGFFGVGVNISTYLFVSATSPTSFSVLGVVKKICQTLLGYALDRPNSVANVVSVIVGLMGGIGYTLAKSLKNRPT
jgi:GDP-mannose transporter